MPRRLATLLVPFFFAVPTLALAEGKKGGMPQLDFADKLLLSQVVWLALIFFALYLLLAQWGLPRVASVLEERARRIGGDLDAARAAKRAADEAIAELEAAARHAHDEAQAAIASATERAKTEALSHAGVLDARLKAELAAAETRIAAAERAAMGALRDAAHETAAALIARLTGRAPEADMVSAAVEQALAAQAAG